MARHVLASPAGCFRVDADLRPEGRSGPLTRTLDGYRAYWDTVGGGLGVPGAAQGPAGGRRRPTLGRSFAEAAGRAGVGPRLQRRRAGRARAMKARAEARSSPARPRRAARSSGAPGASGTSSSPCSCSSWCTVTTTRPSGTAPPSAPWPSWPPAGYVSGDDGAVLADAYRFLRTVEHRLQLVEEEQTHAVPAEPAARRRLARVLGFADESRPPATAPLRRRLRRCQSDVRDHPRALFFRPLLEAFAALDEPDARHRDARTSVDGPDRPRCRPTPWPGAWPPSASATPAHPGRGGGAGRGLTRVSRLMEQLLPLLLDWLSVTPDPDLGLLGLRTLVVRSHHRALVVTTFRESPEAARRLCLVLGSSRTMAEAIDRNPELIAELDDDRRARPDVPRRALVDEATERLQPAGRRRATTGPAGPAHARTRCCASPPGICSTSTTSPAPARPSPTWPRRSSRRRVDHVGPTSPSASSAWAGSAGAEMSYASDLDVLFVFDDARPRPTTGRGDGRGPAALHPRTESRRSGWPPSTSGSAPKGARAAWPATCPATRRYFERWAQTWERQALLRARVVAGDRRPGRALPGPGRTTSSGTAPRATTTWPTSGA